MKAHTKRILRKIIAPIRRIGLKNKNFTIISNNCRGGFIYDIYGLQYRTPTIGTYFFPDDYIKFCKNLKYYLSTDPIPIDVQNSKYKKEILKKGVKVFVAKLEDIEVVFAHYDTIEDAISKRNRRKKRVNFNNILLKFNDQNGFKNKNFDEFLEIKNYDNKIFFTANNKYETNKNCKVVYFNEFRDMGYVLDDIKSSFSKINIKKYLNCLKTNKESQYEN